jgi:hypothetical protein
MKQEQSGVSTTKGYNLFNSGGENRYLRTAFIINEEVRTAVMKFEAISDRIL